MFCLSALFFNLHRCIWICSSDTTLQALFQMMIQFSEYYVNKIAKAGLSNLKIVAKLNHSKL